MRGPPCFSLPSPPDQQVPSPRDYLHSLWGWSPGPCCLSHWSFLADSLLSPCLRSLLWPPLAEAAIPPRVPGWSESRVWILSAIFLHPYPTSSEMWSLSCLSPFHGTPLALSFRAGPTCLPPPGKPFLILPAGLALWLFVPPKDRLCSAF